MRLSSVVRFCSIAPSMIAWIRVGVRRATSLPGWLSSTWICSSGASRWIAENTAGTSAGSLSSTWMPSAVRETLV